MFLWIIVIVMAVALAAEIIALIGMAAVALSAFRRATNIKKEIETRLQPAILFGKEFAATHRSDYERVRSDGSEIGKILTARFRNLRALWQDADRRRQRLRLRIRREGAPRVKLLQYDQQFMRRRVLAPIRTISSVALGVRSAARLLRKVA